MEDVGVLTEEMGGAAVEMEALGQAVEEVDGDGGGCSGVRGCTED